jgi:hypothetical protein
MENNPNSNLQNPIYTIGVGIEVTPNGEIIYHELTNGFKVISQVQAMDQYMVYGILSKITNQVGAIAGTELASDIPRNVPQQQSQQLPPQQQAQVVQPQAPVLPQANSNAFDAEEYRL